MNQEVSMYGMQLLEMAHVAEQEHMRQAALAQTRRQARRGAARRGFGRVLRGR